jgi:Domain of unknown function (DUF4398)
MRAGSIVLALVLIGCGSSFPTPTDQYSAAQRDLGRAQEGGAANVPDAKLHLQLAQEDLGKAKDLMDKDNQRAASLISRASAESELALNLSKQAQAEAAAKSAADALAKAKGGNQ